MSWYLYVRFRVALHYTLRVRRKRYYTLDNENKATQYIIYSTSKTKGTQMLIESKVHVARDLQTTVCIY